MVCKQFLLEAQNTLHLIVFVIDDFNAFDCSLGFSLTFTMRCALVTTSGALLNFTYGPLIDAADYVIRVGQGPVKGFENHIGSKTNARVMSESLFQKYRQIDLSNVAALSDAADLVFLLAKVTFDTLRFQSMIRHATVLHINRPPLVCGVKNPTTGLSALYISFSVLGCASTRVFGFEDLSNAKYHYFSDGRQDGSDKKRADQWYADRKKRGYHDFVREHALVRKMTINSTINRRRFNC